MFREIAVEISNRVLNILILVSICKILNLVTGIILRFVTENKFENIQYIVCNFRILSLKNIINIVKFYVTVVT